MDPTTRSIDPLQRASSSEPSSIRPNPFDDSGVPVPKRRRTSGSVESLNQGPDNSSTSSTLDEEDEELSDIGVKMDSDPATPRTPEQASSSVDPPTDPPSSKVTINLRNDKHSSNLSFPSRRQNSADVEIGDRDAADSASDSEIDLVGGGARSSRSSSLVSGSPPVELVQETDDEVIDVTTPAEGVLPVEQSRYVDPAGDFPYRDAHETLTNTTHRLIEYLRSESPQPVVLEDVQRWLDTYVEFLTVADPQSVAKSLQHHRTFLLFFPEVIVPLYNGSPPLRTPRFRAAIKKFFVSFTRLATYVIKLDIQTMHDAEASLAEERGQTPELCSSGYLYRLHGLTERQKVDEAHSPTLVDGVGSPRNEATVVLDELMSIFGNGLGILEELLTALINILPKFPKLVGNLAHVCQLLSRVMEETAIRMRATTDHEVTLAAGNQLQQGHELWARISACLSVLIETHVNQLSNDGTTCAISSLSDTLKSCLAGTHATAVEQVEKFGRGHPELPPNRRVDAIVLEWHFDILGKLMRCSQMQLRVGGVTHMCARLLKLWGELRDEPNSPLLGHVGDYLLRSGIIEYLLGANCHPEITAESANIVGFLVVTEKYQKEHTDRIWHGITSSQDPRLADALTHIITSIMNLFDLPTLSDICAKFEELPLGRFTPSIRSMWADHLIVQMKEKFRQNPATLSYQPYKLCARLLRESSVCTDGSNVAHPDIQQLAMQKFSDLLSEGPDEAGRAELYRSCLRDLSQKSDTTLGSLWCLSAATRVLPAHELQILTQEHDFTRILIEDFENKVHMASVTGLKSALSGNVNYPRREFVSNILRYQPITIDEALGQTLWDVMVGPRSLGCEDREAGWRILNDIEAQAHGENPFIRTCLSRYLPTLPPACFCEGTLDFVRSEALSLIKENEDFNLDDEPTIRSSCVEQLWRIVLTATNSSLVSRAIRILAEEVYMDSQFMEAYHLRRTRKVHSDLVDRCFMQLREAARSIKGSRDGSSDGDNDSMVIVPTGEQLQEQERLFTRSLQFLKYFLEAHRSRKHFAAPDLRPLISRIPSEATGDPAELKYQSFDGTEQTDIRPLDIGRRNTAGSLLAKIKEETGFQNYRAYYRGQLLQPTEEEVCKSLEDLRIHDLLILVKREEPGKDLAASRYKPGSSFVQIEIMSHFQEMWQYLMLEDNLACEIYQFLVHLPADVSVMESFQNPETSYTDIFPPNQPFRSLYAVHALTEYKKLCRDPKVPRGDTSGSQLFAVSPYDEARRRVIKFIVNAILDANVYSHSTMRLELWVASSLMEILGQWLEDSDGVHMRLDVAELGIDSAERFVALLTKAALSDEAFSFSLIFHTFNTVLRLGLLDTKFWESVVHNSAFRNLATDLILFDSRKQVREQVVASILDFAAKEESLLDAPSGENNGQDEALYPISRYFWDVGLGLICEAAQMPDQCAECFSLLHGLMRGVFAKPCHLVDFHDLAVRTSELLLSHECTEDIDQEEPLDPIPRCLISLLSTCLEANESIAGSASLQKDLAYQLYCRHLFFPRARERPGDPMPKAILNKVTRASLYDVVLRLVRNDRAKFFTILNSINNRVLPYFEGEDDPYLYEIPNSFDRQKGLRAPCGYVGLRNLSNTCYLNSLLVQLYMHTDFRRFILSAREAGPESTQELLSSTKKVFSFMQRSYRRFVDPSEFVQSITDYEGQLLDIQNQMDVGEFYALLFDRWEAQLKSAMEKKKLRSFFEGQLIQQIKSKECEHISERLQPFAAIQCDIKGKKSLKESLQAYVDGEVLEGENKYKCSTCDRHVDAVKRECLKDLPDTVIFHLKRFEFSLRTLQRSKINDYFAFPASIDLKPYTVDHLNDPTLEGEDVFELVGILVHTGTAESGHYYSFIRERPCKSDPPSWVEFNDDHVAPWDPALMEGSTFGGPDFDANGNFYEKAYSAYMLFYQRKSYLSSQQDEIAIKETPVPVRFDIDEELKEHIMVENTNLLRRHCLFDPGYALWVKSLFDNACQLEATANTPSQDSMMDEDETDNGSASAENLRDLAMEVLLSHLDQIVSRTRDLPDFTVYMDTLEEAIRNSAENAYSFYKYFFLRPDALRALIQRNSEPLVRQRMSLQFIRALQKLSSDMPQLYSRAPVDDDLDLDAFDTDSNALVGGRLGVPVVEGVMNIFRYLWKYFHIHIRAWDEYFGTLLGFAQMGKQETACLLGDDYLLKLCRIIAADRMMDLPANYSHMLQSILRRFNTRTTSYLEVISVIDHLLKKLAPTLGPDTIVESPQERLYLQQEPFDWTSMEASFIHDHPRNRNHSFFLEKLLGLDQNPVATDDIVVRLSQLSEQMDASVAQTLRVNIRLDGPSQPVQPFLRAALPYLGSATNASRAERLVAHIAHHAKLMHPVHIPLFLSFFRGALNLDPRTNQLAVRVHDHCLDLVPDWAPCMLAHPVDDVRDVVTQLLHRELFPFGPYHDFGGDEEAYEKHLRRARVIQRLAIQCLLYLQEAYVKRGVAISREQAQRVLETATRCRDYFVLDPDTAQALTDTFAALHQTNMEPLRRLVVEQIEDDGSDCEASCASSEQEQMESIAAELSLQAMHDLNDSHPT